MMVSDGGDRRLVARAALSGLAAAILAVAVVLQVADRDSIEATVLAFAAIPAAPIPFLAASDRIFRLAAGAYAAVFLPYALLFALSFEGADLIHRERWVLGPAVLLMACAASIPRRS